MKELFLIRHAKSSWKDASLEDIERPLSKRGLKDAPFMGNLLLQSGFIPDAIFSSPAMRAFTTAKIIATELNFPKNKIHVDERLYSSDYNQLLEIITEVDVSLNRIFIFGHNPELTLFCNLISDKAVENLQTCAVTGIRFNISEWQAIAAEKGEMFFYEYPKKHLNKKPA